MWRRLSERTRRLLLLLGAVAALAGFWSYVLDPQIAALAEIGGRAAAVQREMAAAETLIAGMSAQREALARAEAELAHLRDRFAADPGDGSLVVEIGLRAAGDGVEVTRFKPLAAAEKTYLRAVPFEVGVRGGYPAVLTYLESLQNLPNAGEIRGLSMQAERDQPGAVGAEVLLVVYADPAPGEPFGAVRQVDGDTGREDAFRPVAGRPAPGVPREPEPAGTGFPAGAPVAAPDRVWAPAWPSK